MHCGRSVGSSYQKCWHVSNSAALVVLVALSQHPAHQTCQYLMCQRKSGWNSWLHNSVLEAFVWNRDVVWISGTPFVNSEPMVNHVSYVSGEKSWWTKFLLPRSWAVKVEIGVCDSILADSKPTASAIGQSFLICCSHAAQSVWCFRCYASENLTILVGFVRLHFSFPHFPMFPFISWCFRKANFQIWATYYDSKRQCAVMDKPSLSDTRIRCLPGRQTVRLAEVYFSFL